jgi:hypothetical protein
VRLSRRAAARASRGSRAVATVGRDFRCVLGPGDSSPDGELRGPETDGAPRRRRRLTAPPHALKPRARGAPPLRRPFGVSQGSCRARALQTFTGYGFPVLRVSSSPAFRVPPQGLRVYPPDGRFAPEPHVEDTNRQSGGTCADSRCLAQSATVDGPPPRALPRVERGSRPSTVTAVGVVAAIPGGTPRPRDPATRERTLWHSV